LAGPNDIANAVALNAMTFPIARLLGPVIAGVLVETVELAWCFALNAISYLAVIAALVFLRVSEFFPRRKTERAKGQLRDALLYVRQTPSVRTPLLAMVVVGTLAFNFTTVMPLMNRFTFGNNPRWLTAALSASAVGSLIGGAVLAGKKESSERTLAIVGIADRLDLGSCRNAGRFRRHVVYDSRDHLVATELGAVDVGPSNGVVWNCILRNNTNWSDPGWLPDRTRKCACPVCCGQHRHGGNWIRSAEHNHIWVWPRRGFDAQA
jgi:hypothetical protein